MPTVSVLVAAYRSTYLEFALESALSQTHSDLEVVVVDDSRSGAVEDIVDRFGDSRVRYVRNASNLGPAGSYARAITEASAPLLSILNDDDLWEESFLERLLEGLNAFPTAVLAFADHWVMVDDRRDEAASNECSRRWKRDRLSPGLHQPFQRMALLDKSVPLAIAALFRRSATGEGEIPTRVGSAYDFFLTYLLCRAGGGAVYVPQRLSTWRTHGDNLTGVASIARAEEGTNVYRILVSDPQLGSLRRELRTAYGEALWVLGTRNLRAGRRWQAVRAAGEAIRQRRYKASLLIPAALLPRLVLPAPELGEEGPRHSDRDSRRAAGD